MVDAIDSIVEDVAALGSNVSTLPVAVTLFNASIYATSRYVPEYLRALRAHPVVIGSFGSVVMLLAVLYPHLVPYSRDSSGDPDAVGVLGGLASLGLVCWLVAPQLGRLWPVPIWSYVVVGAVLVGGWASFGLEPIVGTVGNSWLSGRASDSFAPGETARLAGLVGGVLPMIGLLAGVSGFVVGFQVALALAASLGVTATVLRCCSDGRDDAVSTRPFGGWSETVSNVWSLPRRLRPLLIGDTLVQFALGMISVFVVVTITSVLQVEAHVIGYRLGPSAFFGVLLLVELSVALVTVVPATRLTSEGGRNAIVFLSFLVSAVFPLLLVGVPETPLVIGVLFAVFGLRFAGRPARRALITAELSEAGGDAGTAESYRLVRNVLTVPSALLGGVLYGIGPTFAFILATIVGVIGLREFMEFAIRPHVE